MAGRLGRVRPPLEVGVTDASGGLPPDPEPPTPDWERLYTELGDRVFRLIHRMTDDPDLAADLTHDTFVKVHERREQYSGRGSLYGWVFRIAKNLVRERARQRANRLRLLRRDRPPSTRQSGSNRPGVETRLAVERALQRLPEAQRTTLLLHVVDGYSHAEIAEMLDIAEGSSKARVSRARAALREMLEDNG